MTDADPLARHRVFRLLLEDPEPPGLDPAAPQNDGWDEPLAPDDDGDPLPWIREPEKIGALRAADPSPAGGPAHPWGMLVRPFADAATALARLDARWEDLPIPVQEGLAVRVCWREAALAAFADTPGLRREPLSLWLWQAGLAPSPAMDRRGWEEALDEADAIRVARGLARGLAAALRSAGTDALRPVEAERALARLGAFRHTVRERFDPEAPVELEPRPGFDAEAWSRWTAGALRPDLPPLAAWAEAVWAWQHTSAVADPQTSEAWVMGTHLLRAQGVLRAAPLPLWAGLDRRRQRAAAARRDPVDHAAVLLDGVAAAAREHLGALDGLRSRDAAARAWIAARRAGGLAADLWDLLLAQPALSAVPAAKRLGATPQAVTRVLLALRAAGLVREVSGREAWRVWAAVA